MRSISVGFVLIFILVCRQATAQLDPFTGRNGFPQFRRLSGLAGSGYGVDEDGFGSLSGPTAYSSPTAYVLGHDQFRIGISKASFDSGLHFDNGHSNGKGIITYGHTLGHFNLAFTLLFESVQLDNSYNLQISYTAASGARLVPSIGVQDLLGTGGSAGVGLPTDGFLSQSVFGAVTYRLDTGRRPVYLSAGVGTRRFGKGFASVSYQVVRPLRTWLEFDGWGFNGGILFTVKARSSRHTLEFNTMIGLLRGHYPTVGGVLGF